MEFWRQFRPFLLVGVMISALYSLWIFGGRALERRSWQAAHQPVEPSMNSEFGRTYGGTAVKIVQFYAREGNVTEGQASVICYGVANARAVHIEPKVEGVEVSPNRCVEVSPAHDTRYTLTAEGNDGRTVSASFLLQVKADAATLPKITAFRIADRRTGDAGRAVFLVTWSAQNGEEIAIEPPVFPTLHGTPGGKFYVSPEKATTYTLTVTGAHGHQVKQQLTVPGN